MIRICFLADGQSIHTRRWCAWFSGQGYEVHVISFRDAEIPGATVHFVDCGPVNVAGNNKRFLLKIPQIRRLVKQIAPDIVHAHYATSYGLTGALCGRKPFVLTALGSDVLVSPFENTLYRWLLEFVFRKADWITAMSDPMKDVMIRLGADAAKISTVIFGIDPDVFHAEGRTDAEEPFTLISTRNFEPVYNINVLLKAVAGVKPDIPGLKMHLVGRGSMEGTLKEMIVALKLEDVILFHGQQTQLQIAELLRQSQLFLSVSSSDGNNISLNEAMACGCFSVVSDIPANRQWIQDGLNGYYSTSITERDIAEAIRKAYAAYHEKRQEAFVYNQALIREKALWSENMKKVAYIYTKLMNHER